MIFFDSASPTVPSSNGGALKGLVPFAAGIRRGKPTGKSLTAFLKAARKKSDVARELPVDLVL